MVEPENVSFSQPPRLEAFHNPTHRHTSIGNLSPIDHETRLAEALAPASSPQSPCPENRVGLHLVPW